MTKEERTFWIIALLAGVALLVVMFGGCVSPERRVNSEPEVLRGAPLPEQWTNASPPEPVFIPWGTDENTGGYLVRTNCR